MFNLFSTAGVIDRDYTGEIKIVLFQHSENDVSIKRGDRVAQLICEKIFQPQLQEVEVKILTLSHQIVFTLIFFNQKLYFSS